MCADHQCAYCDHTVTRLCENVTIWRRGGTCVGIGYQNCAQGTGSLWLVIAAGL